MIKIEIKPSQATVETRSGVSKKDGKPYTINEQSAYAFLGGDYPQLFKFNLENGMPAYPAGLYTLHETCLYVGDFQKLRIGKVLLVSLSETTK